MTKRGTVGTSTTLTYSTGKVAAMELQKARTERRWAAKGSEVTVTQLTPGELAERQAAARSKRARTAPAGLRKAPARAEKIPAEKSADAGQHIENLLERIFDKSSC